MGDADIVRLAVADLILGDDFRLDDDPEQITELAGSIRAYGVLQPLLVRPGGGAWEVVAGRRRLAAAREAGLEMVPCIIHGYDDDQAADVALAENLCRRDLSPVEEALAFAQLRERGLTQRAIAAKVNRSQAHVSMLLRILELPSKVRDKIHRRELSYATALKARFRTGKRQGGADRAPTISGDDARVVSHWRRRHDRLVAGIHAVLKEKPSNAADFRRMLDRLLKLDKKPLPADDTGGTRGRPRFKGAA